MRRLIPFMVLLGACRSDQNLHVDRSVPELTLELTSPVYGQFMDDAAVQVEGVVYPPSALVWVEGEAVEVAADGSFLTEVLVDYAYRIVDAEASLDAQTERVRVPVYPRKCVFGAILDFPGVQFENKNYGNIRNN